MRSAYHNRGSGYKGQDQQTSGCHVGAAQPFPVGGLFEDAELGRVDGGLPVRRPLGFQLDRAVHCGRGGVTMTCARA